MENKEFCSLLEELDGRYEVPSRYKLGKEIDDLMSGLKENMMSYLSKARRINICTDIWSKKGMSASFIGITAHFFACHQRHNVTIAIKRMPSPHTAENILTIVNSVLDDWNIPPSKVGQWK